jgi:BRCA1-associated protein
MESHEVLQLVVELPSTMTGETSQENIPQGNKLLYCQPQHKLLRHPSTIDNNQSEMLIVYAERLRLQQFQMDEHEIGFPLMALPIPFQILKELDGLGNGKDQAETTPQPLLKDITNLAHDILSRIHSSLTQLEIYGLIRCIPQNDQKGPRNDWNLLLLKIPVENDTEHVMDEYSEREQYTLLRTILQEVNGEPILSSPTCVIQSFIVSKIDFRGEIHNDQTDHIATHSLLLELPLCPVCRFRLDPRVLRLPSPNTYRQCSRQHDHCENMPFLAPWESPNHCEACSLLQESLKLSGAQPFVHSLSFYTFNYYIQERLRCYECQMEETLWVCLTCGIVGCGRYSQGHAEKHYLERNHPFSLELASQRIWDYKSGSFVQRDDLLNCPLMQKMLGSVNRSTQNVSVNRDEDGNGIVDLNTMTAKKSRMVGAEYEVLLQSALEDQAQYFEGEICHLESTLAAEVVREDELSEEERKQIETLRASIEELRLEVAALGSNLVTLQAEEAGCRARANSLLREQASSKTMLDQVRKEIKDETNLHNTQIEELELQISDLEANLSMRLQIAKSEELCQAQIMGTSTSQKKKTGRKGSRKLWKK